MKKVEDEKNNVSQAKETNTENVKEKNGKFFIAILIFILSIAAVIVCYFAFIKDKDTKKDNNPSKNTEKDKKTDPGKSYNDIIEYSAVISKVKNAKKNVLTKCDCSKVKGETDVDKAVCTEYLVKNDMFITIIDKLRQTKNAEKLPTSIVCTEYSFESYDEDDKKIIFGFVGQNLKSILVGYKGEGYAFDYDKDLTSFFETLISSSTKVEKKDDKKEDESTELSKDEKTLLINKIDKYNLLDLRNTDKKVTITNTVTNDMMNAMFNYVASLDDSFSEHWDETTWSFKRDKADDYFDNAFGFIPKDYSNLVCPVENEALLIYDKTNKTFTYNDEHPGHGGSVSGFFDYNVTSSKKDGNTYIIEVLFLRGNEADGYYINDEEFNIDADYDEEEGTSVYKKEFKKIDPTKYPKYSFEFEKLKGNYILKSITYKK